MTNDCAMELRNAGKASPRTCARCGLGPCTVLTVADTWTPAPTVEESIPAAPDDPYPWARGNALIMLRSYVFEIFVRQGVLGLDAKKDIPALQTYCDWLVTGEQPASSTKLKVV